MEWYMISLDFMSGSITTKALEKEGIAFLPTFLTEVVL